MSTVSPGKWLNQRAARLRAYYRVIDSRRSHRNTLREKWLEALKSVLPISLLVLGACFLLVPMPVDALAAFVFATALLVLGMGLFSLGTDLAMTPIGEGVGRAVTGARKVWLVLLTGLLAGVLVTIAEPDLTVLATQVSAVPNQMLILAVALGVGVFLMLALARILLGIRIRLLLWISYGVVFVLALFTPPQFLPVAFDSGGVTTGLMTVPFILGLGAGVAAIRSDGSAESDGFGLVAFSSVGPIIAVMLLGMFYGADQGVDMQITLLKVEHSLALFGAFWQELPHYMLEVFLAMLPVLIFFLVFQFFALRLRGATLRRVIVGLLFSFLGLTMFLLGVNVGFMPVGYSIGRLIASVQAYRWLLVPLGMLLGWFAVSAEPAVQVLNQQVYEMTAGAIPRRALSLSLSAGVSISVGLAMIRVLTGIPLMAMLIPGYAVALLLTLVTPPVFTAIAFDSGGVASGPMTAAFMLPLAIGATEAVGGNPATDAFGVVAMVAMTPMITIQLLGIAFKQSQRRAEGIESAACEEIIEL